MPLCTIVHNVRALARSHFLLAQFSLFIGCARALWRRGARGSGKRAGDWETNCVIGVVCLLRIRAFVLRMPCQANWCVGGNAWPRAICRVAREGFAAIVEMPFGR